MKMLIKFFALIAATFASMQAFAFTLPYHISGTIIVGTATFKSSGACKIPAEKFVNAQLGNIKDSTDASVGYGVISADGTALLAVTNNVYGSAYSKYIADQNPPGKTIQRYMVSMINADIMQYIADKTDCLPQVVWTNPSSYEEQINHANPVFAGAKQDIYIRQSFVGYVTLAPVLCPRISNITQCKHLKFTGSMSFKGQYTFL